MNCYQEFYLCNTQENELREKLICKFSRLHNLFIILESTYFKHNNNNVINVYNQYKNITE